jgi:radical SAM family uncharacterized protein/radical SAM-linked protein
LDLPTNIIKPGRYADHELNAARKPWDKAEVRLCLAYPDRYEIGMSNLGLAILYSLINRLDFAMADRAYLPAPDMEAAMQETGRPLGGLESGRPLKDFDLLGISLQTELCYTNVLAMLDLAGIPRRAAERSESDPIVLAGGSCCANPEPMAPFFDAMAVGDGEELMVEICHLLQNAKSESRISKLNKLSYLPGVYVPSVHNPLKDVISARHVDRLKLEYAPSPPLVPLVEVTHDRLTVEIARGCTRGCRFCQAGMLYRPARTRSREDVLRLVKEGLTSSGWEEVSLLSLSSSDYPDFPVLLDRVNGLCLGQRVAVSVPSLRLDSFDQAMAGCLKRIKRSSLTFAPEAGSQRLRDAINKGLSDEHLLSALELARRNGWQAVKLYFMIGLPTETPEDLEGITALCRRASQIGLNLKVTISPFVPKPQTPFQWEAQDGLDRLGEKIGFLTRGLRMPRVAVHWHDPRSSVVEGVLARGGRQEAELVEQAYLKGAKSDQWTEHFRWEVWQEVLGFWGVDFSTGFGGRDTSAGLPWSHICYGANRDFLLSERHKAMAGQTTPDCREGDCQGCGATCQNHNLEGRKQKDRAGESDTVAIGSGYSTESSVYGRGKKMLARPVQSAGTRFRIKYGKGPELRFISHLDLIRLWQRAIRRAGLPVSYSQGFTPHQKVSFGPPLPLGMTSRGEYLDLQLDKPWSEDIAAALRQAMNPGLAVLDIKPMTTDSQSLSSWITASEYEVFCPNIDRDDLQKLVTEIKEKVNRKEALFIKSERKGQPVEADIIKQIYDINIINNNKLYVIIKVIDKGLKPGEIMNSLIQIKTKDILKIERVESYHIAEKGLINPFEVVYKKDLY